MKSVWVESADGGYRHFLLDDDNHKRLTDGANRVRKVFRHSDSYELAETQSLNLHLIGSSKSCVPAELPQPINRSRPQTGPSTSKPSPDSQRKKSSKDGQSSSKRNSLHDISQNEPANCDDKLAERVLNWLDLAGKTTSTKPSHPVPNPRSSKRPSAARSKSATRPATAVTKRPDSVKHITIIFNKEGIPVRYNRPVRFADLFRSGYSASRKFLSTIPSRNGGLVGHSSARRAQLPGSAAFERASMDLSKPKCHDVPGSKQISYDMDYRTIINRQILENSCNMREVKKQLHIFMPSLPKKTLVPTDCDSSCLSVGLSDYCKITH